MCVCAINNISHSHPHCKWIGFGEQKITVAFSKKKKNYCCQKKNQKNESYTRSFASGTKVSLVISKNRSKISFMYLFSAAAGFLLSLRLEVARFTGVESLWKPCQPSSYLMASGPPSLRGWSQVRELTNERLGEDQQAELHPRRSTTTLGKTLCMCILIVKSYGLWYHRKHDSVWKTGWPALPKGLCYPHLSKHLVALLHGIRWAAPPGTKAPAQSKSSRTTEGTSLPLEQTTEPYTCTPWHSQTWHPGGCCTISSCQVNSPAPLKPSQDLPAAFPRQPLALSPTTHLLPIPPPPLPAPRLPFGPSSNPATVLPGSLAQASAYPLMPRPHMCPEAPTTHGQGWPPPSVHTAATYSGQGGRSPAVNPDESWTVSTSSSRGLWKVITF